MSNYIEGKLQKNEIGRWSIDDEWEITSGDVIEIKVGDHWIETRIESNTDGYYAVIPGIQLYQEQPAKKWKE